MFKNIFVLLALSWIFTRSTLTIKSYVEVDPSETINKIEGT